MLVPHRFVDSEVNLDGAIGSLLLLTQNPALFFPEIVRLNVLESLVDLLSRESPGCSPVTTTT